ncbi:alpha/beta hydrolase [Vagococcus fluvialis]|uniref:alpha/beta hydrolase n=1 Tax=Vagococcus fluvialis TaxID=2738 RepID=UPI003B59BE1E
MTVTFTFNQLNQLPLNATLHSASNSKGLILYFHGGGLIYGHRDDLPQDYIDHIVASGYSLLTLDYPLIPEIKIDTLVHCLEEGIAHLKELPELQHENLDRLIYFGRSAGAFLALLLSQSNKIESPHQIISFYGYYSLSDSLLTQPSDYYKQYQVVPFMTVYNLLKKEPIVNSSIEERFPIYLSYRQSGNWIKELLGRKNKAQDFSITSDDLKNLPPTFLAASSSDQDVPFSINQEMSQLIPNNKTFFIEGMPHDFDANLQSDQGKKAYAELTNWLDSFI